MRAGGKCIIIRRVGVAREREKERARGDPTGGILPSPLLALQLAHTSATQVIETNNLKKISVCFKIISKKKNVLNSVKFQPGTAVTPAIPTSSPGPSPLFAAERA